MKLRFAVLMPLVVLLTAGTVYPQEQTPVVIAVENSKGAAKTFIVDVEIVLDDGVLASVDMVGDVLSPAAEKTVREKVKGASLLELRGIHVHGFGTRPTGATMVLTLEDGDRDRAKAIVQAICDVWKPMLTDATEKSKGRLKVRLAAAEKKIGPARKRVERAVRDAGSEGGVFWNDPGVLAGQIKALEAERQQLALQLEGKDARIKAIIDVIGRVRAETEETVRTDPVAAELKKIVELEKKALPNLEKLRQAGAASDAVIDQQEIKLAQAKARLAERLEAVRDRHAWGLLKKLNEELVMLSIDKAEMEERDPSIRNRLAELALRYREMSVGRKERSLELKYAEAAIESAMQQREELMRKISDMIDPEVSVQVVREVPTDPKLP
ncbi:MAG TPA: hypothetical protein VMZ50_08085 [Phycisphaerae bacterium]|nr:hypothetical protein [Phycisphaerae bacterium]